MATQIYDLDFANPVPADDPAPLLETFGCSSAASQAPMRASRLGPTAASRRCRPRAPEVQRGCAKSQLFRRLIAPAQHFAPLREDGLADVGLSYRLLRQILRELRTPIAPAGMIEAADDIFWLGKDGGGAGRRPAGFRPGAELPVGGVVPRRRGAIWRAPRRARPPVMLPQIRFLGQDIRERQSRPREQAGATERCSRAWPPSPRSRDRPGPRSARAGGGFNMQAGDVLVAAITTPAWTPLFVRAGRGRRH